MLEGQAAPLPSLQDQVDPPDEILHVTDHLLLENQVPLIDLLEVAAAGPEKAVVVTVGRSLALLQIAQDVVVQLDLTRVEDLLCLEAGPQKPVEDSEEKARESPAEPEARPARTRSPGPRRVGWREARAAAAALPGSS